MAKDYRLAADFCDHPKTMKLIKRLGPAGVVSLLRLWGFAVKYRPRGSLDKMSVADIEIAAKWEGEEGSFVRGLVEVGFLDKRKNGSYALHNWKKRNEYAYHAPERSQRGKIAATARWQKRQTPKHDKISSLSRAEKKVVDPPKSVKSDKNYAVYSFDRRQGGKVGSNPKPTMNDNDLHDTNSINKQCDSHATRNAPIPIPIPIPIPSPSPIPIPSPVPFPDKEKKKKIQKKKKADPSTESIPYAEIIADLNSLINTAYRPTTEETRKAIRRWWRQGFREDDFKTVHRVKAKQWLHDPKMRVYLRPKTLYGDKFEAYLNEARLTGTPLDGMSEAGRATYLAGLEVIDEPES